MCGSGGHEHVGAKLCGRAMRGAGAHRAVRPPAVRPAAPALLLGGQGSLSYPLHVDGVPQEDGSSALDGDVVMTVLQGCKEIVVLADAETADAVEAMKFHEQAYGIDVFDHAAVPG